MFAVRGTRIQRKNGQTATAAQTQANDKSSEKPLHTTRGLVIPLLLPRHCLPVTRRQIPAHVVSAISLIPANQAATMSGKQKSIIVMISNERLSAFLLHIGIKIPASVFYPPSSKSHSLLTRERNMIMTTPEPVDQLNQMKRIDRQVNAEHYTGAVPPLLVISVRTE